MMGAFCPLNCYFYPRPPRGGRRFYNQLLVLVPVFLSTPSARRATAAAICFTIAFIFLSTPSARRATKFLLLANLGRKDFYPRPPRGGRPMSDDGMFCPYKFLSTPSARRATARIQTWLDIKEFLSTPSARRATWITAEKRRGNTNFYPRPPRGGRLFGGGVTIDGAAISIHALREEGDKSFARRRRNASNFYPRPPRGGRPSLPHSTGCGYTISIHALREEGDQVSATAAQTTKYFYPRPPRGGRRGQQHYRASNKTISIHALREEGDDKSKICGIMQIISIHALREEGDSSVAVMSFTLAYFYPRPPRGGRLPALDTRLPRPEFLSTPSARRATSGSRPAWCCHTISIHALREEGDVRSTPRSLPPENFYPRPPRGGRPGTDIILRRDIKISIHALREEGDATSPRSSQMKI